jgi:hypothetical protein
MEYFICIPPQQLVSLKKLLNTKVWWGDFATLCFSSLLLSGWGKKEGRKKKEKKGEVKDRMGLSSHSL